MPRRRSKDISTLLLVEDSASAREQIIRLLGITAFNYLQAPTAAEGLHLAEEEWPDLVLLDLMLPDADGLSVLRQLRENLATAEIPVLVFSARADQEIRLKCLQAGADDYLHKGVPPEELKARVRTITRLNRYQTLRREREKAAQLLQSAPDGVLLLDMEGQILALSQPAAALLGVPKPAELTGQHVDELLPSPDRGPLRLLLQSLENTAHPADVFEQNFILKNGQRMTLRLHYRKLDWEDREAVLFFLQDISDRKSAQELIQRQRQTWRLIGRDAGLGVLECELRQRTLRVSDSWRDMFFYDPLSAPRDLDTYLELVHAEDRASFTQSLELNIARNTERFNLTCRLLDGAGRYRVVDASFWVIPDVSGGAQRLVAWQRETDDKMAEELLPETRALEAMALRKRSGMRLDPPEVEPLSPSDFAPVETLDGLPDREAVHRLRRFLRARDNLLVNLGHEMDTQLNALLGLSQLLVEGTLGPVTARQNQCLRRIERQLIHLADLSSDIEAVMNLEDQDQPREEAPDQEEPS